MSQAKSLAGEVRGTQGSEEFDLSNYEGAQVTDLVNSAFGSTFKGQEYVRVTFVVGGGKKCRQKYSPDLPKDLSQALTALGFTEDRGASACEQCQGSFKYQHDTDKDLKFMHVFPHVEIESAKGPGGEEEEAWEEISPTEWCVICEVDELKGVVTKSSKLVSFAQRKALLTALKDAVKRYDACEQKMIAMEALTDAEQKLYDEANSLADKVEWMTSVLEEMVEGGQLTAQEKSGMLEQLGSKVEIADREIAKAKEEGKAKKADKLQQAREAAAGKAAALAGKPPITHAIRNEKELRSLYKKLAALEKIDNSKQMQSLDEIKKLRDKPDVEARIAELTEDGRGWFVDRGSYEAQLEALKADATKAPAGKKSGGGGGGGFTSVGGKGNKGKLQPMTNKGRASNPYEMLFE